MITERLTQDQINVIVARAAETVRCLAPDPVYVFELPSAPVQVARNQRPDGWCSVGTVVDVPGGRSYAVWWHPVMQCEALSTGEQRDAFGSSLPTPARERLALSTASIAPLPISRARRNGQLSPHQIAAAYDQYVATRWRGLPSDAFAAWLEAHWTTHPPAEPVTRPDAVSDLGSTHRIHWHAQNGAILGFVAGRSRGCYWVPVSAVPPSIVPCEDIDACWHGMVG